MGEAIISRSGGGSSSEIVTPPTPTANMHMLMLKVTDSEGTPLKDWPVKCANNYYYHTNESGYVTFATNTNITQIDIAPYAFYNSEGIHSDYNNTTDHKSAVVYVDQEANCIKYETPIGLSQVSTIKLKERAAGNELNLLNINRYNVYRTDYYTYYGDFDIYTGSVVPSYYFNTFSIFIGIPLNLIFSKDRNCNVYLSGGGGGGGFHGGGGAGGEQKEINGLHLKGSYNAFIGRGGNGGWEANSNYYVSGNLENVISPTAGGTTFFGVYSVQGGNYGNNGKGGIAGTYKGRGANFADSGNFIGESSGMRFGGGGSSQNFKMIEAGYIEDESHGETTKRLYDNGIFNNLYARPCGGISTYWNRYSDKNSDYSTVTIPLAGIGGGGGGGSRGSFKYSGGEQEYRMNFGCDGGPGIILINY